MKIDKESYERRGPGAPPLPGGPRTERIETRLYAKLKEAFDQALDGNVASSGNQLVVEALEDKLGVWPEYDGAPRPERFVLMVRNAPIVDPDGSFLFLPVERMVDLGFFREYLNAGTQDFLIEAGEFAPTGVELRKTVPHGSLLLMDGRSEPGGHICLMRIFFLSGNFTWAIKRYTGGDKPAGKTIRLLDGMGNTVVIDSVNVARVEPLAVVKKVLNFSEL